MMILPPLGYAIYCRDEDSFWTGKGHEMRTSAWVPTLKDAKVFTAPSTLDALDNATVKALQLRAKGWDVLLVCVPPADYKTRGTDDGMAVPTKKAKG